MDGRYETWVERQIREAQERGEFDNLPGSGQPLKSLAQPHDEDWWIRQKIEREQLDMSAALPPQLALRKERQALPEILLAERSEQAVRELAEDFNARVRECWRRPLDGPIVPVRTLDVEQMVADWRAAQPPRAAASRPPSPGSDTVDQRTWLQRTLSRLTRRD